MGPDDKWCQIWIFRKFLIRKIWCQIWVCRMDCIISIVWVHFSHKTEKFQLWKSLKYFNIFWSKKVLQAWMCPVRQFLIWFKLRCLSSVLAISWEIWSLNLFEIVWRFSIKDSVVKSKFVPVFLSICIF